MNCANSQAKNYLFTSSSNKDDLQEFVKVAASLVKENKIVLLFTRNHVDITSILAGLNKEQMQNLMVAYHSDVKSIVEKLLELHDWTILPDFVIVDLNSYFDVTDSQPPFEKVCFCISALLSYMRSVRLLRDVNRRGVAQCKADSVTLLNAHRNIQIQLLIDFYFYKNAAFSELDEIKNKILN